MKLCDHLNDRHIGDAGCLAHLESVTWLRPRWVKVERQWRLGRSSIRLVSNPASCRLANFGSVANCVRTSACTQHKPTSYYTTDLPLTILTTLPSQNECDIKIAGHAVRSTNELLMGAVKWRLCRAGCASVRNATAP